MARSIENFPGAFDPILASARANADSPAASATNVL